MLVRPTGPRRLWPCASPLRPGGVTQLRRGRAGEPPDPEKSPWKGAACTAREASPWCAGTSRAPPQRKPEKPRTVLCVNLPDVASSAPWAQGRESVRLAPHPASPTDSRTGQRRLDGGRGRPPGSEPITGPLLPHTCAHRHMHRDTHAHTGINAHACTQAHVHTDVHA